MANGHWPFYLKIDGQTLKDAMISNLVIQQELGQHSEARASFTRAYELDPTDPRVRRMLEHQTQYPFVTVPEKAER